MSTDTITLADGRTVPIRRSKNEEERKERMLRILEHIAVLPEPERDEAIAYTIGLLDGLAIAQAE